MFNSSPNKLKETKDATEKLLSFRYASFEREKLKLLPDILKYTRKNYYKYSQLLNILQACKKIHYNSEKLALILVELGKKLNSWEPYFMLSDMYSEDCSAFGVSVKPNYVKAEKYLNQLKNYKNSKNIIDFDYNRKVWQAALDKLEDRKARDSTWKAVEDFQERLEYVLKLY